MKQHSRLRREQGAILFISLIILLIITVVAIGSTRLSTTGQRISFNYQMKNTTFQAADSGLTEAKEQLESALGISDFTIELEDPQTGHPLDTAVTIEKGAPLNGSSLSSTAPKYYAYQIISTSQFEDLDVVTELESGYVKAELGNN